MALRVWVLVWVVRAIPSKASSEFIIFMAADTTDPFGLVVTSLPFFAGMQGNGDKEVYGTYRAVIRLELSRYLPSE